MRTLPQYLVPKALTSGKQFYESVRTCVHPIAIDTLIGWMSDVDMAQASVHHGADQ